MSTPAAENTLRGVRVLVTRPAHQAGPLAERIAALGGTPVLLPTLEIADPADPAALDTGLARLGDFAFAVFVSPNAVRAVFARLRIQELPPTLRLAAVGQGTRRALNEAGARNVLAPTERFDSEALLDLLPEAAVRGRRVAIMRGAGGREWLGEELSRRGAEVTALECYRRLPPRTVDATALAQLVEGKIDIVTATSVEGLRNLARIAGPAGLAILRSRPLLVVGERQAEAARELGFHAGLHTATRADDEAIVTALCAWRRAQKNL